MRKNISEYEVKDVILRTKKIMKMNLVRFIPLIIMMMVACAKKSDDQTKDNNEGKT